MSGQGGRRALLLIIAGTLGVQGCVVAAAGAGAGGAIYLTSRGVESIVAAPLDELAAATEGALAELEIERTGLEVDDRRARRTYRGKAAGGDPDVSVTLETQDSGSTRVEVTARTGLATWDKEYARGVLERIVALATGGSA